VDREFLTAHCLRAIESQGQNRHWMSRAKSKTRWRTIKRFGPGDELVELEFSEETRRVNPEIPEHWVVRAIRYERPGFTPQTSGRKDVLGEVIAEFSRLPPRPAGASAMGLSTREREVLKLLAAGATNKEIGRTLILAEGTVKNHVTNILTKLGVSDRTQAAIKARDAGLS